MLWAGITFETGFLYSTTGKRVRPHVLEWDDSVGSLASGLEELDLDWSLCGT